MREPKGSLTLPPFHDVLREWEQYLLYYIHLATLGERSSLDDQSVPRTGERSEPYKIDDR